MFAHNIIIMNIHSTPIRQATSTNTLELPLIRAYIRMNIIICKIASKANIVERFL